MSLIDNIPTVILVASHDYSIRKEILKSTLLGSHLKGFKDVKIVNKGDKYEVPKMDWDLFKAGKNILGYYLIRKVGMKKSYKVHTLYFLDELTPKLKN